MTIVSSERTSQRLPCSVSIVKGTRLIRRGYSLAQAEKVWVPERLNCAGRATSGRCCRSSCRCRHELAQQGVQVFTGDACDASVVAMLAAQLARMRLSSQQWAELRLSGAQNSD